MAQALGVGFSPTSCSSHSPEFQSGAVEGNDRGHSLCSSRGAPSTEEGREFIPGVTSSAELVVVGLQQGLGNAPLLTAAQVLAGALLLRLTAAAWQVAVVLGGGMSGDGQN